MNLAVFDIGTNSIHMLVVEIRPDLSFEVLCHEKDTTRLGDGSFESRRLRKPAMGRALGVLERFQKIAKTSEVKNVVAVATSAVRDAKNGREFVREIYRRTGIRVRIISGNEEARLIELGARSSIETQGKKALVVDIGGGSLELILGDGRTHHFIESFPLGVARLTDRGGEFSQIARGGLRRIPQTGDLAGHGVGADALWRRQHGWSGAARSPSARRS